jgi:hypothetical protein
MEFREIVPQEKKKTGNRSTGLSKLFHQQFLLRQQFDLPGKSCWRMASKLSRCKRDLR